MILNKVIHYKDTNSVEVTWEDENNVIVKCHSYSDAQLEMLCADLGANASEYEVLIAEVEANIAPLPLRTLSEAKSSKLLFVKAEYETAVKTMIGDTDPAEMASWTKQEQEARAWVADNTAITPIIDNLIIGRAMGESKADLVAKIIAKADAYAVAYAQVLGAYHAKQKAIEVATTVAQVEAI